MPVSATTMAEDAARTLKSTSNPTPFISIEESQLVRRAQAGDRDAMATLLTGHEARIFATCHRMVNERETARDLAQDALVKAMQGLDTFDERARFSTWLTRIAINTCISHLRKQKLRRHASLERAAFSTQSDASARLSDRLEQQREQPPTSRVEEDERMAALRLAMEAMPTDQRALLLMRDGRDMDYASIARALGVKVGTVKSRLFRARVALREAMEQMTETNRPSDEEPGETTGRASA